MKLNSLHWPNNLIRIIANQLKQCLPLFLDQPILVFGVPSIEAVVGQHNLRRSFRILCEFWRWLRNLEVFVPSNLAYFLNPVYVIFGHQNLWSHHGTLNVISNILLKFGFIFNVVSFWQLFTIKVEGFFPVVSSIQPSVRPWWCFVAWRLPLCGHFC